MSVQLIAWAFEQQLGSITEKSVLLSLANASNGHTGRCHPSIERLAKETNANEKTVRRALVSLEAKGYIQRERARKNDGTLGIYSYTFPKLDTASHPPDIVSASPPDTESAQEPEVNLEPEEGLATSPRSRPRNPIWDALTAVFGEATTETAQSRRGKVCRSLTAARASPEDVVRRAQSWPRHFDDATLTELALEKHWDVLGRAPLRLSRN